MFLRIAYNLDYRAAGLLLARTFRKSVCLLRNYAIFRGRRGEVEDLPAKMFLGFGRWLVHLQDSYDSGFRLKLFVFRSCCLMARSRRVEVENLARRTYNTRTRLRRPAEISIGPVTPTQIWQHNQTFPSVSEIWANPKKVVMARRRFLVLTNDLGTKRLPG